MMKTFVVDQKLIDWSFLLNTLVDSVNASREFGIGSPEFLNADEAYQKMSEEYYSKYPEEE